MGNASGRRSPTGWRPPGRRGRRSRDGADRRLRPACACHLRRPYTRWTRRRRTPQRAIRVGCRHQFGHDRLDWRPRQDACGGRGGSRRFRFGLSGRRRSSCGASHQTDRRARNGRLRAGRTGSSSCRGLASRLPALAAKAHARNVVTGAMVHCFNRWAWSQRAPSTYRRGLDGRYRCAAVRRGEGNLASRPFRRHIRQPSITGSAPTYSSLCGAVSASRSSAPPARYASPRPTRAGMRPGARAGARAWQAQGGFAMGVGYALLETLPPYETGPGNGNGTSANTLLRAARICRCTTPSLRCCHPSIPRKNQKG